jgi:plasmid maintenance system antidote protein VapI
MNNRRLVLEFLLKKKLGNPTGLRASAALGISETRVSRIICGHETPSEEIILKLEKILGVRRTHFLGEQYIAEVLS